MPASMASFTTYEVRPSTEGWTCKLVDEDEPPRQYPSREHAIRAAARLAKSRTPAQVEVRSPEGDLEEAFLYPGERRSMAGLPGDLRREEETPRGSSLSVEAPNG